MKAIPVLLTVFILLLAPAPAIAGECIQDPVAITGGGYAVTGFVPGESYISVVFDEPIDDLWIVIINVNHPYEILSQSGVGFSAIVRADTTNPKYDYIAGGYRCRVEYRVLMPLVIH